MRRLLLIILVLVCPTLAEDNYMKVVRNKSGEPTKFQTGIATFKGPQGQLVDLIAVIHVADKSYYQRLNQHFKKYDSVLYEMVLDVPRSAEHQNEIRDLLGRDKREPKIDTTRGGRDPLSKFQSKLGDTLGLAFQLDEIDYSPDNFRHADLTLREFEDAMAKKRASPLAMLKELLQGTDDKGPPEYQAMKKLPILKILAQGPNEEERRIMKTGLACQFAQSKDFQADAQGEVLIGKRNEKAIEVLKHRLKRGDKKLAIFYGAAHMSDFSARLRELGYKPLSRNWTTAWEL